MACNCAIRYSWKQGDDLWVLTTERRKGEEPQRYKFQERTAMGLFQGTVELIEQ
jgi:hypothetical protein